MQRINFTDTKEAASLIKDGASIGTVGFLLTCAAEEIFMEMENRFLATGSPNNLDIMWASGVGDGQDVRGLNHLAHKGMLNRLIGGHYGLIPKLVDEVNNNQVEAYNFPQGVLAQMFRDMAANKPGVITHVGLETFVDPEYDGGKLNKITTEDLVQKIEINGEKYLFYESQKIDTAIIRGTEADENGNISFRKEALTVEALAVAMAAKNNGGQVIVQVEKIVKNGTINPKNVIIPGAMVDVVAVVKDKKNHMQTAGTQFNEDFISGEKVLDKEIENIPLTARKVIARRSAMQLNDSHFVLNYGIGVPELVADVLSEEGLGEHFVATVEPGIYGGSAQGGLDFGSSIAPQAVIDEPYQFDFYDGGGIDATFLGMAQCDSNGSLNVSKFGPKIAGCGGFIDISQNSKECIFCGTFTAGGLKTEIVDGKLKIIKEGKIKKFVNELEQITYNGSFESKKDKEITLVTERAVFKVKPEGLVLTEIAPGIDLEKNVLNQMEFKPIIADDLKEMKEEIFNEELMNLKLDK